MPTEFQIIEKFFAGHNKKIRKDVLLGIGDDGALVKVPVNQTLAVSSDTLISGVHFPTNISAYDIGYKSLAVNLSDLAAMGAKPAWVMLALTLPTDNKTWLKNFCKGFFKLINDYDLQLIGGDTTRGTLSITVQVMGFVSAKQALKRSGAKNGDVIYVTGTLGDAALALKCLAKEKTLKNINSSILKRLNKPCPRIETGIALRGIASSAIDISDGLAADLSHILAASKMGASVCVEDLPLSAVLKKNVSHELAINLALNGGDDYELCFTVAPSKEKYLQQLFSQINCKYTRIGVIESKPGLRLHYRNGQRYAGKVRGYQHFN